MVKNFHEKLDVDFTIIVDQLRDYLANLNDIYDISEMSNWSDKLESVVEIIGKSISNSDSIIENIRKYTLKTDEFDNLIFEDEYFDELRECLSLLINENDLLKRVSTSSKDEHNNLILDSNKGVLKMSLLKIDKIYIISLNAGDPSIQRSIAERVDQLGMPYSVGWEIVQGFDGTSGNLLDGHSVYNLWNLGSDSWNDWWKRDVTGGEAGCAISHLNIWKSIISC